MFDNSSCITLFDAMKRNLNMSKLKQLLFSFFAMQCLLTSGLLAQLSADEAGVEKDGNKSKLKVLFVGHDPDNLNPGLGASKLRSKLYKERTATFTSFLRERFQNVEVVFGADYTSELSKSVDVTIFDARPKPLTEAIRSDDIYTPATYLPLDFDRPALLIAGNSPEIGEGIGLKLDWL